MVQEVTEQLTSAAVNTPQLPDRTTVTQVLTLLDSRQLQNGLQAWRLYYHLYGDTEPVPSIQIQSVSFDSQKETLAARKQEAKTIIAYGWPFALERDERGKYRFAVGHKVNDLWSIGEAKLCRGMYARLTGPHEGVILIQLDPGRSRQLYDEDPSPTKEGFFRMLLSALVKDSRIITTKKGVEEGLITDRLLILADHEFQPLHILDINRRAYRHNPHAKFYLPQTAQEPYYTVDYSLLTTTH